MEEDINSNQKEELERVFFWFIFIIIVCLLFFNFDDLEIIIYPVCILCSLLLASIISGKVEISFGSIFKIKKDIEEVKKDISELKISVSQKVESKVNSDININLGKYYSPKNEMLALPKEYTVETDTGELTEEEREEIVEQWLEQQNN
jgi:hypothetical protein